MIDIESKISPYIVSQFPRLYGQSDENLFIAFVKAYFEWLEQPDNPLGKSRALLLNRDIDTTLDEFIDHFKNKYMAGFPTYAVGDKRFLQKHIKTLFGSKGTEQGAKLLFRLLYNLDVEIYYPGDDVLKLSDGVWSIPQYLEVSITAINPFLIGETIVGSISGAKAVVESFEIKTVNGRFVHVLGLSNLRGSFAINEVLINPLATTNKSPYVMGSLGSITINESGFNYNVGDVLSIKDGSGLNGKAVVQKTLPRNGVVTFEIQNGGSGYTNNAPDAPTVVTVTPVGNGNPGTGATFSIGELINTSVITTAVDTIAPYANVVLSANNYGFPAMPTSNINTPMDQALKISTFTVGTISSLTAINQGAGYNGPVTISVVCPVVQGLQIADPNDGSIEGNNAVIIGFTGSGNGTVAQLGIYDSGIGYLKNDTVTMTGANNDFVVGGTVGLTAMGTGRGSWRDNRSFLDADKYIQDSFYFQDYSYEIRAAVAFERYSAVLKDVWHLAGTQPFGKLYVADVIDNGSSSVDFLITG